MSRIKLSTRPGRSGGITPSCGVSWEHQPLNWRRRGCSGVGGGALVNTLVVKRGHLFNVHRSVSRAAIEGLTADALEAN